MQQRHQLIEHMWQDEATLRTIALALGITTNAVWRHVRDLCKCKEPGALSYILESRRPRR